MVTEFICTTLEEIQTCVASQFATTTVNLDLSTIESNLGSLNFGLSIVTTILFLMVIGFFFNNMFSKKPWL